MYYWDYEEYHEDDIEDLFDFFWTQVEMNCPQHY